MVIKNNTHNLRFCDHWDSDSVTRDLKEKRRINGVESEAEDREKSAHAEFPGRLSGGTVKTESRKPGLEQRRKVTTGKGLEAQSWLWSSTEVMSPSE